jgi:hypothetical protein
MFEIQEYTLCDGWINTWSEDDGSPVRFSSLAEAEKELQDFIFDQNEAVFMGCMAECYDIDDYRIVPVEIEGDK